MDVDEAEPSVTITLNTLRLYNTDKAGQSIDNNELTFKLGSSITNSDKDKEDEDQDESSYDSDNANDNDHQDTGFHSSASAESLYARRKRSHEKLGCISTNSDPSIVVNENIGSQSPPTVQYNIYLNKNLLEPPPTPSVADVVRLRYNLSPEIIKEKSENEFNFVIPLPKRSVSDETAVSADAEALKASITPLKYHLSTICTIGKGAFGRVYLTRHRITGRYYALKAMHIPAIIAKRQVEHVHNEKNILQQLKHPFIVNLYDIAKDRKYLYMILEYLSGGELFSYLRMSKKFSSQVVKFYAAEVVLALEYLHSIYIAYRDLKPENLMLTDEGHVKLTDFGFSKMIHNKSYTFCGTSEYLAPEVITRKGHAHGVDHWALGVLIFELMSGKPPFSGKDANAILDAIREQDGHINFPRHTFSPNAKDLISRLLTIDVKKRLGRNSVDEIKQHAWFQYCDWQAVYDKAIFPPLIPTIYFEGDTGNFDSYDETEDLQPAKQRELDLFDDW